MTEKVCVCELDITIFRQKGSPRRIPIGEMD